MSSRTTFIAALTGMVVVLIVLTCALLAVFERASQAASPAFILGFAVISALGFWAMSFHRLGR